MTPAVVAADDPSAGSENSSTGKNPPIGSSAATCKDRVVRCTLRRHERRLAKNRPPEITSFSDFLENHAQVKSGPGYVDYHFEGREALRPIVERIDQILASGQPDVSLALCGGAQFGKTVLMLNLLAYLVAVRFRNVGYYLPDDDLVSGLVDGKLRPDVLDQIPWLANRIAVGKTLNASRRAVNRKGAFLCTDGKRTALAFMRGLGKIPTSFSMDVVMQDEKDDLPEEHARFLAGRMTASNLRLTLIIGTQRYHGAGQNLAFNEGTQHIGLISCPQCKTKHNPETAWPAICRLVQPDRPANEWPQLTHEGHFQSEVAADDPIGGLYPATPYSPNQTYALCCPHCATPLDRANPQWHPQAPEREALRRYSYRISQLLIPGIDLAQIVAAWQLAIRDPAQMNVFCTDRLALPKSSTQTLTPHDLTAARGDYRLKAVTELPNYQINGIKRKGENRELSSQSPENNSVNLVNSVGASLNYAGLDMGDQCWFVARAIEAKPPHTARLLWIEPIAAERVRTRVPQLFRQLHLRALCVDAGPLRDLSRALVFTLNEAAALSGVVAADDPSAVQLLGKPRWNPTTEKWTNARAAAVEFTQREAHGLRHKIGRTQDGHEYPLLAAHRDETIQRIIRELLPAESPLIENPDGTATRISTPRFLLPQPTEATRPVLDLYERHLLAGARQERTADGKTLRYLNKCENHFLLATAYSALAELLSPLHETGPVIPLIRRVPPFRSRAHHERSITG